MRRILKSLIVMTLWTVTAKAQTQPKNVPVQPMHRDIVYATVDFESAKPNGLAAFG
jgi:hypothetical protein